jgi:hypothetical protein
VLFDEVDTIFGRREGNEDLRALLNAGFTRGGQVHRSEAEAKKYVLRSFDVFAPKALAAIGKLPDTVADRCVHIRMKRKTAAEPVERFRRRVVRAEAEHLRAELEAWAAGAAQQLAGAWPVLPEDLDDRAADAWEPLLAIADAARHGWDSRARSAALALAEDKDSEESIGGLLLHHIRESMNGHERMSTVELLAVLVEREDGPWGRWWGERRRCWPNQGSGVPPGETPEPLRHRSEGASGGGRDSTGVRARDVRGGLVPVPTPYPPGRTQQRNTQHESGL